MLMISYVCQAPRTQVSKRTLILTTTTTIMMIIIIIIIIIIIMTKTQLKTYI